MMKYSERRAREREMKNAAPANAIEVASSAAVDMQKELGHMLALLGNLAEHYGAGRITPQDDARVTAWAVKAAPTFKHVVYDLAVLNAGLSRVKMAPGFD